MNSNRLGKKIFVLAFLIVVLVGVFALQEDSFGKGYFTWLKDKLVGLGPELNLAKEDSGLDMSSVNLDSLFLEREEKELVIEESDGLDRGLVMEQIFDEETLPEKKVVASNNIQEELLRIQGEINEIAQQVEIIKIEVQNLITSQELSQG